MIDAGVFTRRSTAGYNSNSIPSESHGTVSSGTEDFNCGIPQHTVNVTGNCTFTVSGETAAGAEFSQRINVTGGGSPTITLEAEVKILADSAQNFSSMDDGVHLAEWVKYADYLDFDAGTTEISVGDTIEGGTSGATATVIQVDVDSGSWATNDAAGTIYMVERVGTFQNNEAIEVSSTSYATADGVNGDAWNLLVASE
jgi:hypothetical protein